MSKIFKLHIRSKMILVVIPLLIGSFTINGYISSLSLQNSILHKSSQLSIYKMDHFINYSLQQWNNLSLSEFAEDTVYIEIVKDSLASYAGGMIDHESESVFALNSEGKLQFSTANLESSPSQVIQLSSRSGYKGSNLMLFSLEGKDYIGLSRHLAALDWDVYILEDEDSFTADLRVLLKRQILTSLITLLIIIIAMIVSLSKIISPIQKFRKIIHNITETQDFSRHLLIEYPDEIGDLAYDFNNMITNLDLVHKKLKKYALDEAVARKEVFCRENETMDILARASDYKDPETGAHITRVSEYARILSISLDHSIDMQDLVYRATPLHDIGKLGIPDSILLKPGRLSPEEKKIMQTHTTIGYKILQNPSSKYLKAGAVIALSHHERYDGSGYPQGLIGEDIPIMGRIVSIVDVFDALTSNRPYKTAWSFNDAVEYLGSLKGQHFDPELIDLFLKRIDDVRNIYNTVKE